MLKNLQHAFLFTLISLTSHELIAQSKPHQNGSGAISGQVVDGKLQEPLPFVTVFVRMAGSSEVLTGQITNESGYFRIEALPAGQYVIQLQFVGFESVTQEIQIDGSKTHLELGTLLMYDDVETLEAVEVTAERSTIEQKVDRKVINIGKDLATVGPTAADLMVNLPSINVDQDGGISLRGNDNVIVLVDGKPTNQSASQLLQQIPSGSIKAIELITNPSAKYVPEGMSGIINIVLHKNTNLGFNGSINSGLTIGRKLRQNAALDLNYRARKVNLFINYATTGGPSPTWGTLDRTEEGSSEVWYALNDRRSHLIKAGLDVDVSEQTILSFYSVVNAFNNEAYRSTDIVFPDDELNFGQAYGSEVDNFTTTYNFDIKHQLNERSSIELELDYSLFDGEEGADFDFYGTAFAVSEATEVMSSVRANTTINLDYESNWSNDRRLQLGLEARIQRTDNSYETTNPNFVSGNYELDRDIYAAYFNFSQQLGRWSYQLGARLESFEQQSLYSEEGSGGTSYDDLIRSIYPSAFLTYTPDPQVQRDAFNLSISRRVDRPNISQLNPMRAWSSARITNVGNPSLFPQFTNSAEFNYTRQFESWSLTSGVFYRRIHDEITRFGFNDEDNSGNILFSYDNYQNNSAYGFEVSGNYQVSPKWSLTSSFDLYAQTQRGVAQDVFREVQNVLYNFRMNHSFKANKKLTFQLIGLYRGGNTNLQYRTLSFYFINAGARYSLFDGQGTLSLNFNDIFHTQRFAFSGKRPAPQVGHYDWDSQTLFVGYAHKFGKGQRRSPKRKTRDKNEAKSAGGF
ncbi:MAG: outer membrane beta-barrel protein [Bacteroidota bacterium]